MKTKKIIGLPVAITSYDGAIDWITTHALKGDRAYAVEAANTHVAALARHDPKFGEAMSVFDLICPDGMPLVWSINRNLPQSERLKDRVYGPTLMQKCIEHSEGRADLKHFLLGGSETTLKKLETNLGKEYSGAEIAGSYSPPFGEWPKEEFEKICNLIKVSGANHVWVGLGCPKQELWIAKHKDELPPACYFGIGAAFAFHAGEVKQAPAIYQRIGMEWAYRLCKEPRRLFKRYFKYNSLFIYYLFMGWVGEFLKEK